MDTERLKGVYFTVGATFRSGQRRRLPCRRAWEPGQLMLVPAAQCNDIAFKVKCTRLKGAISVYHDSVNSSAGLTFRPE